MGRKDLEVEDTGGMGRSSELVLRKFHGDVEFRSRG